MPSCAILLKNGVDTVRSVVSLYCIELYPKSSASRKMIFGLTALCTHDDDRGEEEEEEEGDVIDENDDDNEPERLDSASASTTQPVDTKRSRTALRTTTGPQKLCGASYVVALTFCTAGSCSSSHASLSTL